MEQKAKKGLYTIIYPFMASVLSLAGLAKECFAVIFGLWYSQDQRPIPVSLITLQTITGGTRPAVTHAIHKLEEAGLILAVRTPGKKTIYDVTIPEQTLVEFKELYANNKPVNSFNTKEYTPNTSSSKANLPQIKIKEKPNIVITPLKVKPAGEIRTGGLKEA